MTVARGDDVTLAGEDMGFDEQQLAVVANGGVSHDEQCIAKGFQLRTAMHLKRVFKGQLMQVELLLEAGQLRVGGLLQSYPDEMIGLGCPGSALIEGNITDFLPFCTPLLQQLGPWRYRFFNLSVAQKHARSLIRLIKRV